MDNRASSKDSSEDRDEGRGKDDSGIGSKYLFS
jgi:hypothetical protein